MLIKIKIGTRSKEDFFILIGVNFLVIIATQGKIIDRDRSPLALVISGNSFISVENSGESRI